MKSEFEKSESQQIDPKAHQKSKNLTLTFSKIEF